MVNKLFLLIAVLSAGCAVAEQQSQILDSPVVPFSELFSPADTIRLDPSIIIGQISFLDVNQNGNLLISDGLGRRIDLFSSSGNHLRAYSVPECLPDDSEDFYPFSSRFMGADHVVTRLSGGGVVVFSTDGRCVGASRNLPIFSLGFCTSEDSIFFLSVPMPVAKTPDHNSIAVFSPELRKLRDIPVEWPEFPRLNVGRMGIAGRNIDCFGDGPYYTYLESMDAIPAWSRVEIQRPAFFEKRPHDLSRHLSREAKRVEWNKYITTDGVFAVDHQTRMLVYRNLDDQWQPEGLEDDSFRMGISVASNVGQFPPRSTITYVWPLAAGEGYVYSKGDPELLPDGDVGNPIVLRYRFVPPQPHR